MAEYKASALLKLRPVQVKTPATNGAMDKTAAVITTRTHGWSNMLASRI